MNQKIKTIFHDHGIHNVTTNIEYVDHDEKDIEACFSSDICGRYQAWCCQSYPRKAHPYSYNEEDDTVETQLIVTVKDE